MWVARLGSALVAAALTAGCLDAAKHAGGNRPDAADPGNDAAQFPDPDPETGEEGSDNQGDPAGDVAEAADPADPDGVATPDGAVEADAGADPDAGAEPDDEGDAADAGLDPGSQETPDHDDEAGDGQDPPQCAGDGDCDDGNGCTTDTCDPVLGCIRTAVADGTTCEIAGGCEAACAEGVCTGLAAETCDGTDDDCDGSTDEGCDDDHDGWCDAGMVTDGSPAACPLGGGDCDDHAPLVHPGAVEVCNLVDDDCDGAEPEGDIPGCVAFYEDVDGDGYGRITSSRCLCAAAGSFRTLVPGDCDDGNAAASPAATESCATAFDDDCDGTANEPDADGCTPWFEDADGDGYGTTDSRCLCAPAGAHAADVPGDCDDADADVHPGAAALCGRDADCDGGAPDPGEACDDGNAVAWDGCTDCQPSEFRVNTHTAGHQGAPDVAALSTGGAVAVWESDGQDGSLGGVYGQRLLADGTADGPEFRVNGETLDQQAEPAVAALPDGRFVAVWQGPDGDQTGVFGRLFLADGSAEGPDILVNAETANFQGSAAVAPFPDGRFLVAWSHRYVSTAGDVSTSILIQRFKADGAKDGSPATALKRDGDHYWRVAIATQENGRFLVAALKDDYLQGQRFQPAGAKDGNFFAVQGLGGSYPFSVATLTTGSYAFAFGNGSGSSAPDLAAKLVSVEGSVGSLVAVAAGAGDQTEPAVAALDGGDFAIAWQSNSGKDGYDVFRQRWHPTLTSAGPAMRVNEYVAGSQAYPSAATLADGRLIVVWQSDGQDGAGGGIYGRVVEAD